MSKERRMDNKVIDRDTIKEFKKRRQEKFERKTKQQLQFNVRSIPL